MDSFEEQIINKENETHHHYRQLLTVLIHCYERGETNPEEKQNLIQFLKNTQTKIKSK